jgi:hypothetical protein
MKQMESFSKDRVALAGRKEKMASEGKFLVGADKRWQGSILFLCLPPRPVAGIRKV